MTSFNPSASWITTSAPILSKPGGPHSTPSMCPPVLVVTSTLVVMCSSFLCVIAGSPRQPATCVEEPACRAIVIEERELHGCARALVDGLRAAVAVEVGRRVSGIGGVDLDAGVREFLRVLHGHHVERGFGRWVCDGIEPGVLPRWIAMVREPSDLARHHHDARRGRRPPEKREHRVGHRHGGEDVDLEHAAHLVELYLARLGATEDD